SQTPKNRPYRHTRFYRAGRAGKAPNTCRFRPAGERGSESKGMTSTHPPRPNYSRRFFWFALAILAGIALYTAGWYYAAGELTRQVNAGVAGLNGGGKRASCENAQARGYPF